MVKAGEATAPGDSVLPSQYRMAKAREAGGQRELGLVLVDDPGEIGDEQEQAARTPESVAVATGEVRVRKEVVEAARDHARATAAPVDPPPMTSARGKLAPITPP